ncbi:hypothetical protein ANI02nite_09990 [Acetobacter nitrogenifigens DSM 23921 = NBRC 105050]|uniref:Uncharacterized protein n=1 Tax=Acetobacter nitrogenifigens DSM 23921 = NBRC 105050 TaxID=1120919 RepID=A0A511X861_9PROT|nr:hypothetical protein ANI02nite_09990 [Acetobacter nitrogenifigens DSM 23921 = NBRC 105050]
MLKLELVLRKLGYAGAKHGIEGLTSGAGDKVEEDASMGHGTISNVDWTNARHARRFAPGRKNRLKRPVVNWTKTISENTNP